jgi:hypothetical protein
MSFDPENEPKQLPNFEIGVNPSASILEASPSQYVNQKSFPENINWYWQKFVMWFGNLTTETKFLVGVLGLIFGYAMAQAMLKLIASIISVALLLILVYLGYKFLVSGVEQNQH